MSNVSPTGALEKKFCLPLLSPPSLAILNRLDYNFFIKGKNMAYLC